jgi:RNA polymerase sigma-32 factor
MENGMYRTVDRDARLCDDSPADCRKNAMRKLLPLNFAQALKRVPRLSASEEIELFARLKTGDRRARERLVLSQLRYVIHIARKYRRSGCPLPDLVQEGTLGLMEAIKRFNPDRGIRLSTFAMWWIRAAIQDYVIRSRSIVRVATTPRHRSMFFSHAVSSERDGLTLDVTRKVAKHFNTTVEDVRAFAQRLRQPDLSLENPLAESGTLGDTLSDAAPDPEAALATKRERLDLVRRLRTSIPRLTRRERHILRRRFLSDKRDSLTKIGRDLGVSKERVRQLEIRALAKIRAGLAPARAG